MRLCTVTAFSSLTAKALAMAVQPGCVCCGMGLGVTSGCHPLGTGKGCQCAYVHPPARVLHGGCARVPEQGVLLRLCTMTDRH